MKHTIVFALALLVASSPALGYPLYGSEDTGIKRLEQARLAHEGVIEGRKKVSGELLSVEQVDLRLLDHPDVTLPAPDPAFTAEIAGLLGGSANRYSISVLDLSDLNNIRYAEHNGNERRNPGSVGKIIVATAVFQALADTYPDDIDKRLEILRNTTITADDFILRDSHKVRFWNPETRQLTRRPLQIGDRGSLYEWLDWMLSASSNAAAATMQEHAMLINNYGTAYPPTNEAAAAFFSDTPKKDLGDLLVRTIQDPLSRNGIDLEQMRQGSFFTRTGKQKVPGTNSYSTTRELMNFMLHLEQGKIVDVFTSREIKRLLYMTERRIRYASSPALRDSAVYFKSGSLYKCVAEEGFTCKKYHGNKLNLMNSAAIVESPAGSARLHYIVTMTSNVLRKNSAVDHQTLATRIHRIIEKDHGASE